ncbi:MAG: hypothetical protein LBP86_03790 [Azoarcus sp.]|jgi:hypothetical protein|nr:hypothetical protein [Azoarcus sp.]
MNGPRTSREALIAELLGDLDGLLARVEALPALIADMEKTLAETTFALENASDKYRMTVTTFTEQAKIDLAEYFDRKAAQAAQTACKTLAEQQTALYEAARAAFRSGVPLSGQALRESRRSMYGRLMEHGITALIASGMTAGLVYVMFQL